MKKIFTPKYIIIVLIAIVWGTFFAFAHRPMVYNCADFATWQDAENVFKQNSKDIYHLDRDHDGIPCESLMGKSKNY